MDGKLPQTLYNASPIWLQNLLLSAYGLNLYRLRYGGIFEQQLEQLEQAQAYTLAELHELQNRKLQRLLMHAASNVPWYRQQFAEHGLRPEQIDLHQLHQLPVLRKEQVKAHGAQLIAENLAPRSLHTLNTSGTTGSPLVVKASSHALQRNYAFFERFLRSAGVNSRARSVTFAGRLLLPPQQHGPPYWRQNWPMNTLHCSSYHISPETAGEYVRRIARFQPEFIDAYPSAIYSLSRYILDTGNTPGIQLKAVITSSETLLEHQRNCIESAFGCRVFDQYGSAEMAACITQCEHGSYHVNSDYGIVEIIKDDGSPAAPGESGDLICTGFINDAMPMIRYRIGDSAIATDQPCPCGLAWPVIGSLLGRLDDLVVTTDGRQVGRLDPLFKGLSGIKEAQIVQVALDKVIVNLVKAADYQSSTSASLVEALQRRLGSDMQVELNFISHIPRTASGKFRAVISELSLPQARTEGVNKHTVAQG